MLTKSGRWGNAKYRYGRKTFKFNGNDGRYRECIVVISYSGGSIMFRCISFAVLCSLCLFLFSGSVSAQQAYGQQWATSHAQDWQRFYHYPYVYYPHNFNSPEQQQSGPNLYHRYPAEMRVPAYDKTWINFYPSKRRYHRGNHFRLDIF